MNVDRRVTIKDIARVAGVSAQTVSRVINSSPDVSQQTRERVETLIAEMDYHPNTIARSLVKQSSTNIGVMVSSMKFTGPHLFLTGIERQASEMGYSLILSLMEEPIPHDLQSQVRRLLAHQVSGIVWLVPEFNDNYHWWRQPEQASLLQKVPIVFMNCKPTPGFTVVAPDDRYGGYLATRHLLEQGYQNIAMITGPKDGWESNERRLGYQNALAEFGVIPSDRQIVEGNWLADGGAAGFLRLMDQFPEMDALFASGDWMALGALHAANSLGIKIPEQIALVGYDNWLETEYFVPPLTSVNRQHIEVGKLAVRELHRKIMALKAGRPVEDGSILLQPQLVVRQSSPRKKVLEELR